MSAEVDESSELESSENTSKQEAIAEVAHNLKSRPLGKPATVWEWRITDVARKANAAKTGAIPFLCSVPFQTNTTGYNVSLRLFLYGNESGKGTHISIYLTILQGEHDFELCWPFQHTVIFILLDQEGRRNNINRAFCPDPFSASFSKPTTDANISSGIPNFAPLSVLENSSYVKNDKMNIRVKFL